MLAASWTLADVQVSVPRTLTVSEAKTHLPTADIVWREDPKQTKWHPAEPSPIIALLNARRGKG